MDPRTPAFYQPSGKCPTMALILGAVAIPVIALVLGGIYALAIFYCPFVYINFFLTIGFGLGVGWGVGWMLKFGKLRNNKIALGIGAIAGIVSLYVSWVVWIYIASEYTLLVIHPGDLWGVIGALAEDGVWEMFGATPSGIFLYLIWLIEAGMIFFFAAFTPVGILDAIFCEHCDRWVGKEEVGSRHLDFGESEEQFGAVLEAVANGDVLQLNTLPRADSDAAAYLEAETSSCRTCQALNFLSLNTVVISLDSDGKPEEKKEALLSNMFLTPTEFDGLRSNTQAPLGTPPPPQT